jgi:hypothetical protein
LVLFHYIIMAERKETFPLVLRQLLTSLSQDFLTNGSIEVGAFPGSAMRSNQSPPETTSRVSSEVFAESDSKEWTCGHKSCYVGWHANQMGTMTLIDKFCHTYYYRKWKYEEMVRESSMSFLENLDETLEKRYNDVFEKLDVCKRDQAKLDQLLKLVRLIVHSPSRYVILFEEYVKRDGNNRSVIDFMEFATSKKLDVYDIPIPQEEFAQKEFDTSLQETVEKLSTLLQ